MDGDERSDALIRHVCQGLASVDRGEGSQCEIARRFCVGLTFVFRLLRRRRDADTLDPMHAARGCPPLALRPDDRQRLADLIGKQPDATLEQLRERDGFSGER